MRAQTQTHSKEQTVTTNIHRKNAKKCRQTLAFLFNEIPRSWRAFMDARVSDASCAKVQRAMGGRDDRPIELYTDCS